MNQALWANVTIIVASLFGQGVKCQQMDVVLTESRIFMRRRDTDSITASLAARARKLAGNMSRFVPLSPQAPDWHPPQQRGVCNLETTIF
jgi:hypothetical protein